MANTTNHVAKKISRHDVEEDLIKQIALNNPITLDDLDPELRKSVLTWGAPSGAAYDDSDLRKRVVQLESNMAVNTVHDNQIDKDIIDINDRINKNKNDIAQKADKTEIRSNTDPIQITDLSSDLQDKINYSYGYYQAVVPDGLSGNVNASDLATVNALLAKLQNTKADKTAIDGCRQKSDSITVSDMDSYCADAINAASGVNAALDNKANKSDLSSYRQTSLLIGENDLESALRNKIDKSYSMVDNVDAAVTSIVETKTESLRDDFKDSIIGNTNYYLQLDPSAGDNDPLSGMPYRRQLVIRAGHSSTSDPLYDTYTVADILTWIIRDVAGIQYDEGVIDKATQINICNFVDSQGDKTFRHYDSKRDSMSGSSLGIPHKSFTLTEAIGYILNVIATMKSNSSILESNVTNLQANINSLQSDVSSLRSRLSALESSMNTVKSDISSVKSDISSMKSDINSLKSGGASS